VDYQLFIKPNLMHAESDDKIYEGDVYGLWSEREGPYATATSF